MRSVNNPIRKPGKALTEYLDRIFGLEDKVEELGMESEFRQLQALTALAEEPSSVLVSSTHIR